jgi:Tol biopolymer transport system component
VDAGNDDLCSVNADGSGFARLTNDPARDYGAAWKPDGSTLAFATTRYLGDQIAVLNVAGGGVMRAGLDGFGPSWSPDGTQLAFVQTLEDCGGWDYSRPAASGGTRSARPRGASGCSTYDAVSVAYSNGSNVRVFTTGNQPAWRPHP